MRKFDESSPITYCFGNPTNPLIRINKKGETEYFNSVKEKKNVIIERKKTDKFLLVWGGQWKSDVFELEEKDYKLVLEHYK